MCVVVVTYIGSIITCPDFDIAINLTNIIRQIIFTLAASKFDVLQYSLEAAVKMRIM